MQTEYYRCLINQRGGNAMITLKEYISQYRMNDGRLYCKLEEGLQSRYTRQVYESYIDYVYECEKNISEEDLCTLKQVYGINNYIKEKEEHKGKEHTILGNKANALETLRYYELEKFTEEYNNSPSTEETDIIKINGDIMNLLNIHTSFDDFCDCYDQLNDDDKKIVHKLIAHYELNFPIREVIYNNQHILLSLRDLGHARSLFLDRWRKELEKNPEYQELKDKAEGTSKVERQTNKYFTYVLFVVINIIMVIMIWYIVIPLLKIVGKIWFVGFEAMTNTNVTGGKEIASTHGQSSDFDFILGFLLSIMLIISTIFLFVKKKL